MQRIQDSASKIGFLMIASTVCVAILICVIKGLVTLESKDFLVLASMAFTYYFTRVRNKQESVSETVKPMATLDDRGQ